MKTLHSFALELLVGVGIALQAWTLSNVVDVRERVARLEARSAAPASSELEERPRVELVDQAVDQGLEQRLKIVARAEGAPANHAELYDRVRALRRHARPPVVPDEPSGIADARGVPVGGIHAR